MKHTADIVRRINVPTRTKPRVSDLHYLLKEGRLDEFVSLKDERVKSWKQERYAVCVDCGKQKLRAMFSGESKRCKQCVAVKKRIAPLRRREYQKEYNRTVGQENWCAKQIVYNLKKMGLLVQSPCQVCGIEQTYAHHPDYNKPWEVMWLCKAHHAQWHKENTPKYVNE